MTAPSSNDLLLRSFTRNLRARNRCPKTIKSYLEAATLLRAHVDERDLTVLGRGDIEGFIADQLRHHRPTTEASSSSTAAIEEEIISTSPMTGLRPRARTQLGSSGTPSVRRN